MSARVLSLHLPGTPNYLITARSFVGAVARVLGLVGSPLDDLRLATSELLTVAIERGVPRVEISVQNQEDAIQVHISTGGSQLEIPEATAELLHNLLGSEGWAMADAWLLPIRVLR
ncbi:MAG: ATP-binding protein [Acidimicrobiia bacterium]